MLFEEYWKIGVQQTQLVLEMIGIYLLSLCWSYFNYDFFSFMQMEGIKL